MADKNPQSLMQKYFTDELKQTLAGVKTPHGFTALDAVRSGMENPDSSVGVYAGDEESYTLFAKLFDPVIQEYHGYGKDGVHKADLNPGNLKVRNLDPEGRFIISTRIRVGRNLQGTGFSPAITREERLTVAEKAVAALVNLSGDLRGQYYPLSDMSEETRVQLVQDHFLFKKGDRFLESAGANRDWPEGRGIFHSKDKRFLAWVNEEDQLRIISMQEGGNVGEVFERLSYAIRALETSLTFAYTDHLGYLSSCPTNLGTAMRASVHIKLPKLGKDEANLKRICGEMRLSVRGIHGEHSESENGTFDISNKQRLGISETEAVNVMAQGIQELIAQETKLS